MNRVKVEERKDLERDNLRDVTREVNEIKCEMHDIKNMLTQLLEK